MAKSMSGPPALNAIQKFGNQKAGTRDMINSLLQLVVFVMLGWAFYGQHSNLRMASSPDSTFIDCLYFTMVTATTVGYGDIYCDRDNRTKLVTIFFALVGLVAIGGAIGTIANGFIEKAKAKAKAKQKKMLDEANQLGDALDIEEEDGDGIDAPEDVEEVAPAVPATPLKEVEEAAEESTEEVGDQTLDRTDSSASLKRSSTKNGKIVKKRRKSNDEETSKDTFASPSGSPKESETNEPETATSVAVPPVTKKNQVVPATATVQVQDQPLVNTGGGKGGKTGFEMFLLKLMCILRCCIPVYVYIVCCFILAAVENYNTTAENNYKWDVLDTFYFAIITLTTVGFGDLAPKSQPGRLLCSFVLPMGVMVLTIVLGLVSEELPQVGKGGEKTIKDLLGELRAVIEQDDDGTVTEEEYLLFCLIREQKVDEETLSILRKQFQALDADKSGELDEDDVNILNEKCNQLGL